MNKPKLLRSLRVLCASGIFIAGCGSDSDSDSETSDVTTETLAEESSDDGSSAPDDGTTDATSEDSIDEVKPPPRWVTVPSSVRESGALAASEDIDRHPRLTDSSGACASGLKDVVAVYWPDPDQERSTLIVPNVAGAPASFELEHDPEVAAVADVAFFKTNGVDSPVNVSQSLWAAGWFASPVYEMYPAPARMFFPGTLPVPSAPLADPPPVLWWDALDAEPSDAVDVIDTGGQDFRNIMGGDQDLYVGSGDFPDNWVVGHGVFTAGVILQHAPNAAITHYRMPRPDLEGNTVQSSSFNELDLADAAETAFNEGDAIYTNLSAGHGVCEHGWTQGEAVYAPSVVSAVATFDYMTAGGRTLVAAAGNAGNAEPVDAPLTLPAAFADMGAIEGSGAAIYPNCVSGNDQAQFVTDSKGTTISCQSAADLFDDPESSQGPVIAVGASDLSPGTDGSDGEPYTTTADWVTEYAQGCHTSWYPARSATYPEHESQRASGIEFDEVDGNDAWSLADWCGSSFATAVVTARLIHPE